MSRSTFMKDSTVIDIVTFLIVLLVAVVALAGFGVAVGKVISRAEVRASCGLVDARTGQCLDGRYRIQ